MDTTFKLSEIKDFLSISDDKFDLNHTINTWSDDKKLLVLNKVLSFINHFSMFKDSGDTLYENKGLMLPESSYPANGGIGSFVLACSTDWGTSTEFLPGTTVTGASLFYTNETPAGGASFSADSLGNMQVDTGTKQSAGFSGTWRLLSRVYMGSSVNVFPLGFFQRIE